MDDFGSFWHLCKDSSSRTTSSWSFFFVFATSSLPLYHHLIFLQVGWHVQATNLRSVQKQNQQLKCLNWISDRRWPYWWILGTFSVRFYKIPLIGGSSGLGPHEVPTWRSWVYMKKCFFFSELRTWIPSFKISWRSIWSSSVKILRTLAPSCERACLLFERW